ncbi:MAG: PAS domain-containing sensor histidine kinase [Bacteroidetes bacterium]|nr:MAG: PAS domain-containing sensor histidine kinase [Bacteroidota bacterium]
MVNPNTNIFLLENALDNLLEGFQIISPEWKYLYVNKSVIKQSKCNSKEDLIGFTMMEKFPGSENTKLFKVLSRCMLKGNSKYFENKFDFPDGTQGWFELRIEPIPQGLFILSIDITERKQAEKEIEIKSADLLKANAELDRFVYSVAHDLRSPLTSILGLLSFIEQDDNEFEKIKHLNLIKSRIEKMDEFIKNVLSYSKNNRIEVKVQNISIRKEIDDKLNIYKNLLESNMIDIQLEIDQSVPFYCDHTRFSMIIENLISNAIKYHDPKKSNRYIKIKGNADINVVNLIFEDNGIGIPYKHQDKIFKMFYRVSNQIPGSGLGLFIVKETLEKLGGKIWVDSIPKIKTSFNCEIRNYLS